MVDLWGQAGPGGPRNPFKKWRASHTPQPFSLKLCAELVAVLVCFLACDGKARSMGDDPDFMRCFAACSKPDPRCFSACGGPAAELRAISIGQLQLRHYANHVGFHEAVDDACQVFGLSAPKTRGRCRHHFRLRARRPSPGKQKIYPPLPNNIHRKRIKRLRPWRDLCGHFPETQLWMLLGLLHPHQGALSKSSSLCRDRSPEICCRRKKRVRSISRGRCPDRSHRRRLIFALGIFGGRVGASFAQQGLRHFKSGLQARAAGGPSRSRVHDRRRLRHHLQCFRTSRQTLALWLLRDPLRARHPHEV